MKSRHLLCIAHAYPPVLKSSTFRTRAFINYLTESTEPRWHVSIVSSEIGDDPIDSSLLDGQPPSVHVHRTGVQDRFAQLRTFVGRLAGPRRDRKGVEAGTGGRASNGTCRCAVMPASCDSSQSRDQGEPPTSVGADIAANRSRDREGAVFAHAGKFHFSTAVPNPPTPTLRNAIKQWLYTPDSYVDWIIPVVHVALRMHRVRPFDAIYATAPPFSALVAAEKIARRIGVPLIADFRDPWVDNPYRDERHGLATWRDRKRERRVIFGAAGIICASPTMSDRLTRRYPQRADRIHTIINGFDRERILAQPAHAADRLPTASNARGAADTHPIRAVTGRERTLHSDQFILAHGGQFYGKRTADVWFRALNRLSKSTAPSDRTPVLIHVGPQRMDGIDLIDLAHCEGVGHMVCCLGHLPHADALAVLAGADALVLNGFDGPGAELQIPNKLFEYLYLHRPIIAAVCDESPVRQILRDADANFLACGPEDDAAIAAGVTRLIAGDQLRANAAWSGADRFDRRHRCEEFADVLCELVY